jgi:peptidoglycan/LPS O-acetylase OafA/YrhL
MTAVTLVQTRPAKLRVGTPPTVENTPAPPLPPADSPTATAPPQSLPRLRLPGLDLLRTIGVAAVVYSHISYYFVDGMGTGWWFIDATYRVFVDGMGLNQHLTFFGVALFMFLTGALITPSAMRHRPRVFLLHRISRLAPLLWATIAVAIVLVRLHVNGMFSGGSSIGDVAAPLSFLLVGFFHRPEIDVLGVAWTLVVQIAFYCCCVAGRRWLWTRPQLVSAAAAGVCAAVLVYDRIFPAATLVIVGKVASTLPVAFLGQTVYFAWTRRMSRPWILVCAAAQMGVLWLTAQLHGWWSGTGHYVWTVCVVAILVLTLANWNGPTTRSALVHWVGTRSYAIYLVHTLILYKVYQLTVGWVGKTGAVIAFLAVTAAAAEFGYRWIEVPAGRWLAERVVGRAD